MVTHGGMLSMDGWSAPRAYHTEAGLHFLVDGYTINLIPKRKRWHIFASIHFAKKIAVTLGGILSIRRRSAPRAFHIRGDACSLGL